MPEQSIGAWHQHDTDGEFESVCVVAEGNDDVAYFVVKREIDGNTVRYVERMGGRWFDAPEDAYFVDCGGTYDGTNTGAETMTISGGTDWDADEDLTLTRSSGGFSSPGDIGDAVVITDADGVEYTLTITAVTSSTAVTVRTDKTIPAALQAVATTTWAFARNVISGLSWLEGETVNILADGAVHPQRRVSSGAITLDSPAAVVQVGLPITADVQTLPLAIQVEGFGQGRMKNVNQVFLRVSDSSGVFVGPSLNLLTQYKQRTTEAYGSAPDLKSEELRMSVSPAWGDSAQIWVRQSDPLPITIVGMTLEVSIGG
jgi:hypothetical protein